MRHCLYLLFAYEHNIMKTEAGWRQQGSLDSLSWFYSNNDDKFGRVFAEAAADHLAREDLRGLCA